MKKFKMKKIALFAIIALTAVVSMQLHKIKRYEKVLFVLTSHSELGDTGFWTEEFAAPYYELADKGNH
jgi:hypothetical protein